MTSGSRGLFNKILEKIKFKSTVQFYQTELRYLLRKYRISEVLIKHISQSLGFKNKSIFTLIWLSNQRMIKGFTQI